MRLGLPTQVVLAMLWWRCRAATASRPAFIPASTSPKSENADFFALVLCRGGG